MAKLQIHRRTVIKGAGTIAIALPWLEVMGEGRRAHAQSATPKRFISIYQPGGTVREKYLPTGSDASFTLSPILMPLEPYKGKLLVVDGLHMKCADQAMYNVEQHQGGSVGWLTGAIQPGAGNLPKSPSIDQVLAAKLSAGKAYNSLELAVRWATGKSHGKIHPINAMFFQATAPFSPIPPRLDPQDIFTTLFGSSGGTGAGGAGGTADITPARKKSILDFVDKKYASLAMKLGASDRMRLEDHLTKLRDLEKRIMITATPPATGGACKAPTRVDTTGYNPTSGLNADDDGKVRDLQTDMKIPDVGKFMMDMMVMALACDRTAVASLQWTDTEAKHTFPWLSLSEHHHFYQHDGGFNAAACEKIANWYSQMHAYLLQKMSQVDMGGHTLLDESVVFFGSELSHPSTHGKANMPLFLVGGAPLKGGRVIKYNNVPHNKLLTSILNLYGDTRTKFGDDRIESTPLTGPTLTA